MTSNRVFFSTSSRKVRCARRFLQSLLRIRQRRPGSLSSEEVRQRSRRIKMAAYSSMACTVGSRRAWSRAIIFRLQSRAGRHGRMRRRCLGVKKKPSREMSQADRLRDLVPGGEALDFCNLLEETAHYIKCLSSQVEIMKSIADIYCRSWRWHTVLHTETWKSKKKKKRKKKKKKEEVYGHRIDGLLEWWWYVSKLW